MTPTRLAFGAGLLSAAGVYVLILGTLSTDYEWWPPGDRTPAYYCHWTLVGIFDVALLATAALDWGAWGLPRPVSLAGLAAALVGTAVFVWGARTMQSAETMGVTGDLYTSGPYAYTRNPQYVGMIVGVTGFALLADSAPVATLAAVHVGWVLLLPRAEEPHLRAEFGDAYDRYATRVPRFVGLRTVRRAVSSVERVNSRGSDAHPMDADGTIREYYEALRRGEPLYPYFAERDDVVKFGVGERLVGYDAIAEGLREQTRTTEDWTVESQALRVTERDDHAHFSDTVFMAWTDREADTEYALSTRWSGTLERRDDEWVFVGMHVSTPYVE